MLKRMPLLAKVWAGYLLVSLLGLLLNYVSFLAWQRRASYALSYSIGFGMWDIDTGAFVLLTLLFALLYLALGYLANDNRAMMVKAALCICSPTFITVILVLFGYQSELFYFLNPLQSGIGGLFRNDPLLTPFVFGAIVFASIFIGLGYLIKGRLLRRKSAASPE